MFLLGILGVSGKRLEKSSLPNLIFFFFFLKKYRDLVDHITRKPMAVTQLYWAGVEATLAGHRCFLCTANLGGAVLNLA